MPTTDTRTMGCDICGHRYSQPYMAETIVGEGTTQETITHCRGGRCATEEAHQEHHRATVGLMVATLTRDLRESTG